jgi:hypothetical protein
VQAVLGDQALLDRLAWIGRWRADQPQLAQLEAARDRVDQVRDHHRRGLLAVVVRAAADVRDQEVLARAEQRFEEHVAVVVARDAVARPRLVLHAIEAVHRAPARKAVVAHADQAHHFERHAAHRHELAKRDAARQVAARSGPRLERAFERRQQRAQRDRLEEARSRGVRHEIRERRADRRALRGVLVALADQE